MSASGEAAGDGAQGSGAGGDSTPPRDAPQHGALGGAGGGPGDTVPHDGAHPPVASEGAAAAAPGSGGAAVDADGASEGAGHAAPAPPPAWFTAEYEEDTEFLARRPPVTEEQQPLLEQLWQRFDARFRGTCADTRLRFDDDLLLRYLRATDWDVDAAEASLRKTVEWRVDHRIGELTPEAVGAELDTGKLVVAGHDRLGRPVIWMRPARENTRSHDDNIRNVCLALERAVALMPPGVEKWVVVVDYNGYSMMNAPPMRTSKETLDIFMSHFPERLGMALLVDSPWVFGAAWTVLSGLMKEETRRKIFFVKGSAERGQPKYEKFAQHFDMSIVPKEYGGELDSTYDREAYVASLPAPLPVLRPALSPRSRQRATAPAAAASS